MAFPTFVNDRITGSIAQADTKVLGDSPGIAMGDLCQATARALAAAAHDSAGAQPQSHVTSQAAATTGVVTLFALDTTTGVSAADVLAGGTRSPLEDLL